MRAYRKLNTELFRVDHGQLGSSARFVGLPEKFVLVPLMSLGQSWVLSLASIGARLDRRYLTNAGKFSPGAGAALALIPFPSKPTLYA